MYDQTALSGMKLSELKEIARELKLKKAESLKKVDLITKILEAQGAKGDKPKSIGPDFVGDDAALTELATADEPLPVEDPEPPAPDDDEDEDDDDDEENGEEDEEEEEEESGTEAVKPDA
ncbi:MAG TPA: Rho termination factor N-terminal domain-containing protein, partial [Flavobacteriales bacterium]|nr:Rho termination factor N-terminal domain-containing protein [Flavobacteriales bacterium]